MHELQQALDAARQRYVTANPKSREADKQAEQYLPGGNTRTVLYHDPFPLTMVQGEGPELVDLDGHRYVDFVGEFSAGLFGHSDARIKSAIHHALDHGIALGGVTRYERELARLLCERFPSLEQLRFCNSGTEAALMAITTARLVTGRDKVLVFNGAYHGGVVKFPTGLSRFNAPYDFVVADYNDVEGTAQLIRQIGDKLAAVMVEPILGAGGNIPGTRAFLETLRRASREVGALLIFDEVKTARLGPGGVQTLLDVTPDLTTLGKFIAGGLPTGAFGGSAELMACYNPKQEGASKHAGTFNNNVCSMAAGVVALGEVFTPQRAKEFFEWSEDYRQSFNAMFAEKSVPMVCNGLGSMFAIHFSAKPLERMTPRSPDCHLLNALLHMELLLDGVLICSRGDMFLSLPMNDTHLDRARNALMGFADRHQALIAAVVKG
ncbi:MAG: aminotransferase class III-fold pyridoxal phosphate-dependent enzyme [Phycisphaerales bacterium]|nr:aminotransferase class III-fold pyridoxal phosphate-dependent enzyme [Phycisphaerales bacterium]